MTGRAQLPLTITLWTEVPCKAGQLPTRFFQVIEKSLPGFFQRFRMLIWIVDRMLTGPALVTLYLYYRLLRFGYHRTPFTLSNLGLCHIL